MRVRWLVGLALVFAILLWWLARGEAPADAPRAGGPADGELRADSPPEPPVQAPRRRLAPRPEAPEEPPEDAEEAPPEELPDELSAYFWAACAVRGAGGVESAILFPEGLGTRQGMQAAGPVHIRGGHLWLPRSLPAGAGALAVEGYGPTRITWDPRTGACSPATIELGPPAATVTGVVRNAEGRRAGRVFVEGCGGRSMTDEDGAYAMELLPGDCALRAFRQDGFFMARSEPTTIRVRPGDDLVVDLRLPEVPRGGVGMRVREHDEGVAVDGIVPGSPAEQAGLGEGDVVLAVDGQPAVDMDLDEFVDRVTGDAGTSVELLVQTAAGEDRVLNLTRTPLGPQD